MSDIVAPLAVILLCITVGILTQIALRLRRIERWLAGWPPREATAASESAAAEDSAGGAFEIFLNEDPARRALPKGEQFSAYRRWRQEHGLNWSNS